MTQPLSATSVVRVIRLTRRIARQCSRPGWRLPLRIVCETIANGSQRVVEPHREGRGLTVLFEKMFAGDERLGMPRRAGAVVKVLGELTGSTCVALLLLSPLPSRKKISRKSGFLNRACSK